MVSNRCKMVVKEELKNLGLHFIVVDLGEVEIMENISMDQREILKANLLRGDAKLLFFRLRDLPAMTAIFK